MADYNEKVVNLAAALDKVELVPVGTPVDSVYINGEVPVGVVLKIFCGARAGIQLRSFASLELCPGESQGIVVSTVGVAAQQLSIILGKGVYLQSA